jgi:hypothetical protein
MNVESEGSLAAKFVCFECVPDQFLHAKFSTSSHTARCFYCREEKSGVTVSDLAKVVDEVFEKYYRKCAECPSKGKPANTIFNEMIRSQYPAIGNEIFGQLRKYDKGDRFIRCVNFSLAHAGNYDDLCAKIKHENRFFANDSDKLFSSLFEGLESYVRTFGDDESERYIYRARKVDTDEEVVNVYSSMNTELVAPNPSCAKAGRMNPHGIPVFYASLERDTCLAEIRLPVGGRAVVGKFELIRSLKVLDLTVFAGGLATARMFNPECDNISHKWDFLCSFQNDISKPVIPREEELEYLPSQVITEYLRRKYCLDGIIFRSSQTDDDKKNITLFRDASHLECKADDGVVDRPSQAKLVGEYRWDENENDIAFDIYHAMQTETSQQPNPTLRLLESEVELVCARSVTYKYAPIKVRRCNAE